MNAGTRETVLSDAHRGYLNGHAVSDAVIAAAGIFSYGDEIVFPWRDGELATLQQRSWPEPEEGMAPGVPKYRWETGHPLHLAAWRPVDGLAPDAPVIIAEGTKQSLAVASWAPPEYAVYGMAGCDGWRDLSVTALNRFAGRQVIIMLDADAGDNLNVYEAGELLAAELESEDAIPGFVPSPAWGTQGIDDYLARVPEGRRDGKLAKLLAKAGPVPAPRRPTRRKMGDQQPDTGGLPMVTVNKDRREVIREILGHMQQRWNGLALFNYGGAITRLRDAGTEPLGEGAFLRWLIETVVPVKYTPPGATSPGRYEPCWPDTQTVKALLASYDEFTPLERISRTPFIRPDGTVCVKQGYDPATATMLITGNSGMDRLDIAESPTRADAVWAASYLLDTWLGDRPEAGKRGIPWLDAASRANALALVLTPFIRGLVPLVPLAVVSGLQPGVGKGLLADCIELMTAGETAPPLQWIPDDDEENRKQITAAFRSGTWLIWFDEAHQIESAALSRAITSLTYADRILGLSQQISFPNRMMWLATGNQVQASADMARRAYFIELHPDDPDPQDLTEDRFTHPDLRGWTLDARPELVTAALTLIRAWYAAGQPAFPRGSRLGSFEAWDTMMSGILGYAGVPGFLSNIASRRAERDISGSYWAEHLAWLSGQFGAGEFACLDVKTRAIASAGAWDAPPRLEDASREGFARMLGQGYSRHAGRWFGSRRLCKSGTGHNNTVRWSVQVRDLPGTRPPVSDTQPEQGGGQRGEQTAPASPPAPANANRGGSLSDTQPEQALSIPTIGRGEQFSGYPPLQTLPELGKEADSGLPGATGGLSNLGVSAHGGAHARTRVTREGRADPPGPPVTPVTPAGPVLGFDLETGAAGDLFTYTPRDETGYVRLAGVTGPSGANTITGAGQLLGLLRAAWRYYGHNILGFDGLALARHAGLDWDEFCDGAVDTELIARQAFPPRSRESGTSADKLGLDAVAQLLGIPGKTDDLARLAARHGGYDAIPLDDPEYRSYLYGDLDATRGVGSALLHHYDADPYLPREHALARIAGHMSLHGAAVDIPLLEQRYEAGEQRKRDALAMLAGAWGLPLSRQVMRGRGASRHEETQEFDSPLATEEGRAWLEQMWRRYQVPAPPVTKTGKLSIGSDELARVSRDPGCPADLRAMLTLMGIVTTTRTVYQTARDWLAADGRVHPKISFRQASGRWSVTEPGLTVFGKHEGRHVERDIIIASPGCVLLSFDLEQVDMRAIAGHCQDRAYMELFAPGRDAHSEIAARVFGEAPRDARGRHPRRQDAKARGHGWNYGMGPDRMIRDGVPPDMAYGFDEGMKTGFPVLCDAREQWRAIARAGGILDNGFGRRMRADPRHAHTVAPALMGQGGARDIMGECLLRLDPALYKHLILQVHDEIILDIPAADAGEAAAECRRAMTWTWRDVPILCDQAGPGRSWGELSAK